MGKAFVKIGNLPAAPEPTKSQHVILDEDVERMLTNRATGRGHRKMRCDLSKETRI